MVAAERTAVPYLQSPASAHGRVERVFSFGARKVATAGAPKPVAYLPPWMRDADRPVPDLDEFVVASAAHLLKAQALAAIDGRRTIDEIAALVAKRYGLQRSEARGAVERILLEIFEAMEVNTRTARAAHRVTCYALTARGGSARSSARAISSTFTSVFQLRAVPALSSLFSRTAFDSFDRPTRRDNRDRSPVPASRSSRCPCAT